MTLGGDATGRKAEVPRTVLVASLSAIRGDGRILRQIDAVLDAGHSVVAFGAPGGGVHPAEASGALRFVDVPVPGWSPLRKLAATAGFAIGGILPFALSAPFAARYPGIAALKHSMLADPALRSCRPFFAIANDWQALPAVLAVHRAAGVAFHYDAHEFATEEHAHNTLWALAFSRLIRKIEGQGVRAAHSVSSPSPGICRALAEMYGRSGRIAPVRNVGDHGSLPPRATGTAVSVRTTACSRLIAGWKP